MTVHSEFQVVILAAGEGSRMYPLTDEIPKALLPVGNRPLIWYPIQALKRFGFQDVIVVTRHSHRERIHQAMTFSCGKEISFSVVAIGDDVDTGTAESLRHIKDKIKTDVFVLSCDLVSDISLHALADVHRTNDASVTSLFANCVDFSLDGDATQAKGRKKVKERDQKDFVAVDPTTGRLIFIDSETETGTDYSVLSIRKSLLKRYPNLLLRNDLCDAHCYIFKPWVLDYLTETRSLDSIRSDLIPHLVRKQFSRSRPQNPPSSLVPGDVLPDVFQFANEDDVTSSARSWSSYPVPSCTANVIRCHALVYDGDVCIRVNTLPAYSYANRQATKVLPLLSDHGDLPPVHPTATIKERSQVGNDSLVGESVSIAEGVSIKRSIVGNHCIIGPKVKITNSVIMDDVTIKEGCIINGCVICHRGSIADKCNLKDCHIGSGHTMKENVELKGEVVTQETIGFDD